MKLRRNNSTARIRVVTVLVVFLTITGISGRPQRTSAVDTVVNGTIEDALSGWEVFTSQPANTVTAMVDPSNPANHLAHFSVTQTAPASGWHLNLVQKNQNLQSLEPGTEYTLQFTGRASTPRPLKLELSENLPAYRNLGLIGGVQLQTTAATYRVNFRTAPTLPANTPPSSGIWLALVATPITGDMWVDDLQIYPAATVSYAETDLQLASFDQAESWTVGQWADGGTVDTVNVHEGDAGLQLTAATNTMQYISRELPVNAGQTPWDMTFWVYTETPDTIGRLSVLARSGGDAAEDYTAWSQSGLHAGWNKIVVPHDVFFQPYWYIDNFTWSAVRTIAFKLEANGNGPASVTLDDLRLEPPAEFDRRPPVVSHINITNVTADGATVSWTTQEDATGELHCGATTAYGITLDAATAQTSQAINLSALTAGLTYHCRIDATDTAALVGSSGDFTVSTAPATNPVPENPAATFDLGLADVNGSTSASLIEATGINGGPFDRYHSFWWVKCVIDQGEVQAYLDAAQASGAKVLMGVGCNPIDTSLSLPIVRAFKNHPAVAGWLTFDEPEVRGISPADVDTVYNAIKAEDPNHPVVISSNAFGLPGYQYTSGYDQVLLDIYPVPFSPIDSLPARFEQAEATGKVWGFFYQAFQWDIDRWVGSYGGPSRYPSAAEMRAMPFLAVNHGASSLWAFSYKVLNSLPGSEWKWTELTALGQELQRLRPLFASTTAPTIGATTGNTAIDLGIRRYQGQEYLTAVNTSPVSVTTALSLAQYTGTTARDIEDNRTLGIVSGNLNDTWAPFEVHIYSVTPLDADPMPPTVSITSPANGALVGRQQTITVNASDDFLMNRVQMSVDGAPLGTPLVIAPYAMSWDTANLTPGAHTLTATAYDASGNHAATFITVTVDNIAPATSVTAPTGGSYVSGTAVSLTGVASDATGIAGVQFKVDGVTVGAEDLTSPYQTTWDTTAAAGGSHTITTVARDPAGNTTTSTGMAVIVDNVLPTGSISSPAANAIVSGTSTQLQAAASDNQGVAGVQFKVDGVTVGAEDLTPPYAATWNTATASEGAHQVTAVIRDRANLTVTTAQVPVRVDNQPPPASAQVRDGAGADQQFTNVKTQFTANWDAVIDPGSGVVRYDMAIGTTAGGTNTLSWTNVGLVTTYTKTSLNLTNGTTYYASIRAVDAAGRVGATRSSNGVKIDTTAPTTSITSPAASTRVSGTITVKANAADNNTVVGVQFKVDGVNVGAIDTTSPYQISLNTANLSNGNRFLSSVATDAAGNVTTSSTVKINVQN